MAFHLNPDLEGYMRHFTASLTTMVHVIASINATVSVRDI